MARWLWRLESFLFVVELSTRALTVRPSGVCARSSCWRWPWGSHVLEAWEELRGVRAEVSVLPPHTMSPTIMLVCVSRMTTRRNMASLHLPWWSSHLISILALFPFPSYGSSRREGLSWSIMPDTHMYLMSRYQVSNIRVSSNWYLNCLDRHPQVPHMILGYRVCKYIGIRRSGCVLSLTRRRALAREPHGANWSEWVVLLSKGQEHVR